MKTKLKFLPTNMRFWAIISNGAILFVELGQQNIAINCVSRTHKQKK